MDAAARLRQMSSGYQVSQAVYVAATLGISDLIAERGRTADELAERTGCNPDSLHRLLRALVVLGVYEQDPDGVIGNTELGAALRSDVAGSIAGWAAFIGRPSHWQAWGGLLENVRTGENAFRALHGEDAWALRRRHPEEQAIFDRAMSANAGALAAGVATSYDFSPFATLVDVGGGAGTLLADILQRHPHLRGVVFDQPAVVERAGPVLERAGVADRCELRAGSFFESVPDGADAYLLKAIIHDWTDEESVAILQVCHRAMPASAVLLLVEQLLNEGPDPVRTALSDLNMMVGPGGRERTVEEYRVLLARSGFTLSGTTATGTAVYVIEARPTTADDQATARPGAAG